MTTAESSTDVLPGLTNERHPDIFNLKARPKVTEKKPGQLPEHMIKQFFEDVNIIFRFEIFFFKMRLLILRKARVHYLKQYSDIHVLHDA